MTPQLYDHNESVCCQKVRVALAEKGVAWEKVLVDFSTAQQHTPEFRAINPKGVVPVMIHDGRTITESTVINEYIDEAFPGPALMPQAPYARARKRYWSRQVDQLHQPHIAAISFAIAFRHNLLGALPTAEAREAYLAQQRDPVSAEMQRQTFDLGLDAPMFTAAIVEFDRFLADMEATLADSAWLAGETFTLADVDVAPYIWRLNTLQLSGMWAERPAVTDWCRRVWNRPSWQQEVVGEHLPEWLEAMRSHGEAAWPRVAALLKTVR